MPSPFPGMDPYIESPNIWNDFHGNLIEILSPGNKRPGHEAYDAYRRKRRDLLRSAAHLMEIDLLRGGERPPLERPVPPAPYYVVLSRVERRPKVEVWPIQGDNNRLSRVGFSSPISYAAAFVLSSVREGVE